MGRWETAALLKPGAAVRTAKQLILACQQGDMRCHLCRFSIQLVPSTCNSSLRDGTISHRKHSSVWRSPRDTASESSNSVVLVFPSPTPNSPACGGSSCWGSLAHQCHPPTGRQLLQGQPAPHPEEEGTRGKTPRLPFLKMFLSLSERWLYSLINQSSNLKCLRHYAGASWDLEVSDEHHSTEKQFKFSL